MRNRVGSRGRALGLVAVLALIVSTLSVGSAAAQEQTGPKWLERNPVPEGAPYEIGDVGANGRVQFSGPLARVYGEAGDGYALIAGADMLSVCTDEAPPSKPGIAYRGDGHFVIRTAPGGEQIRTYLYKTDLGVFEFFDAVCGGFFENGTPIPAPFASGLATIRVFERPEALPWVNPEQGPGRYRNSVQGVLADADGNTFDVSSFAGFVVSDEGEFMFNRLELNVAPTAQ